jgi:hypothetical protein
MRHARIDIDRSRQVVERTRLAHERDVDVLEVVVLAERWIASRAREKAAQAKWRARHRKVARRVRKARAARRAVHGVEEIAR